MYNKINIILLVLALLSAGCKNFVEQALDDSNQIALEEPPEIGIPILKKNSGILFDFKSPINMFWVANDKLALQKSGDTLRVDLRDCGQKYECWGTEMSDLYDFTDAQVLKVTARMEGNMVPTLGISLKDMDGYDTNLDRPSQRIMKSPDYMEYYFDFTGKWKQIWPDKQTVDFKQIREILFFVNPGGMNWSGTIYIDEIQAIKAEDMPSPEELKKRRRELREKMRLQKEGGAQAEPETEPVTPESSSTINVVKTAAPETIDDFSGDLQSWWVSEKSKMNLLQDNGNMIADLNGVGPAYELFGRPFDKIDFTQTPVVKVRFKSEGQTPGELRVDIRDMDGFTTNARPVVKKFQSGTEFVEYYYDFTGNFEQTYPNVQKVDPSRIVGVMLFVNPGGNPFTGKLIIDEITAISLADLEKVKK